MSVGKNFAFVLTSANSFLVLHSLFHSQQVSNILHSYHMFLSSIQHTMSGFGSNTWKFPGSQMKAPKCPLFKYSCQR